MQNEPEENVTYESCVWTPQQMDTWIAGNASTITSDPYSTKLIMPESDTFNPVDAATALSDTNAQGLISIIGGHLYGTSAGAILHSFGRQPERNLDDRVRSLELSDTHLGPGLDDVWRIDP